MMNQTERANYLIERLAEENETRERIPTSRSEQWRMLRGLMNMREARETDSEFITIQDEDLREMNLEKGIVTLADLDPIQEDIYLWQGDITRLKCGAIVNAANSSLLGCFIPNHNCIDNVIHSFSGVQLRLACADIIEKQGHEEPNGSAKITLAFNLPCDYVIHTVGPIVGGKLTQKEINLLASSYRSCLKLAVEYKLESIAFCCVSTGAFSFPNDKAAEIAVRTVKEFKAEIGSPIKVIFNVFKDLDLAIYREILAN